MLHHTRRVTKRRTCRTARDATHLCRRAHACLAARPKSPALRRRRGRALAAQEHGTARRTSSSVESSKRPQWRPQAVDGLGRHTVTSKAREKSCFALCWRASSIRMAHERQNPSVIALVTAQLMKWTALAVVANIYQPYDDFGKSLARRRVAACQSLRKSRGRCSTLSSRSRTCLDWTALSSWLIGT